MATDKWGREWNLSENEVCPVCGQPDNCGDCDHTQLSEKEIKILQNLDQKG